MTQARWPRFVAGAIALVVGAFLLLAVLLGGVNRDDPIDRIVTALLAGLCVGGGLLALLRHARLAALNLLAALVGWMAWTLATAPDALRSSAAWWGALAIAAGLAWNAGRRP